MESKVNFQLNLNEDNFRLLENDGYCSIAEIDFLHLGLNRNKCDISKEAVDKSINSFYNKPLLCILDNSIMPSLSVDFKEHAYSDEERKKFIAFGTIPESSNFKYETRENGKTYLTAKVVIWKNYFPIIMNILKRRNGNVKVSIELAVLEGEQDDITGILRIDEFRLLSCVLLGENIMEGIEGSHMEILRFSLNEEDFKNANDYYKTFATHNKEYGIPEEIINSISEGMKIYKIAGRGCTSKDLAFAQNMLSNKTINQEQIKNISNILLNSKNDENSLVYNILGGKIMEEWAGVIMNNLNENEVCEFAKEDYGTGETIKVDKSKEAMSEKEWGSVDKIALRNKVLKAKNYKTLVKNVYALVEEGWEEAPSSKLKYPIMEIKEDTAVYNRYALASALAYAKQHNETAVVTKIQGLYKKLDIEDEGEGGEKKMAEDVKEEIVENKLDEDNKDIEEIRDDADAQEDDVKEEMKNSAPDEEVKHQSEVEVPEIKVNTIEEDDKGEEGLKDDVDADKDYWKEKVNALEIKNAELEEEIKKYKRQDEERAMSAEIDKFAHCMSENEVAELKNCIPELTMSEMKDKINEKVAGFALSMKEVKKEVNYSVNPMFELNTMNFSEKEVHDLDSIISNSSVKIAE